MSASGARARPKPTPLPLPRHPAAEIFPILARTWPLDGFGPIAAIAVQLPEPGELPPGSALIVREGAPAPAGFRRWFAMFRRAKKVDAAVRCTALLARGYREIGAATDPRSGETVAFGYAPTSDQSF